MEGIKIQKDIRDNCEELRDALSDICKWEKEMKEKEKHLMSKEKIEQVQPVRSFNKQPHRSRNIQDIKKSAFLSSDATPSLHDESSTRKNRADKCKEKGNYHVKIGEFDKAIHCYTDAINLYNSDPAFYTNRALCYLKINKFMDCIDDCNQALRLNPKTVKAFYRRMQAYEFMGEQEKALHECKEILELEPKNLEAKKSLERIKKKLEEKKPAERSFTSKVKKTIGKPLFTELSDEVKIVNTMNKPAHLRSKKALKRIAIGETFGGPLNSEKESKNVENSSIASSNNSHISDEVIDKLFNSNEYSNYKQIPTRVIPAPDLDLDNCKQISTKITPALDLEPDNNYKKITTASDLVSDKKISPSQSSSIIIPPAPQSTCQFYVTWKELSQENKYQYLKSIKISNINKILGAGIDCETLSDILRILSEYYIKNNDSVLEILCELSKNNEIAILALFFSDKDRAALAKLITYMQERKDSVDDVGFIKSKFSIL